MEVRLGERVYAERRAYVKISIVRKLIEESSDAQSVSLCLRWYVVDSLVQFAETFRRDLCSTARCYGIGVGGEAGSVRELRRDVEFGLQEAGDTHAAKGSEVGCGSNHVDMGVEIPW